MNFPAWLGQLRRLRPVLWVLSLVFVALMVSLTWEASTAYDDGALGTAAFLIIATLGLPFVIPAQIASSVSPLLTVPVGLVVGLGFYVGLDRLVSGPMRWRERTGADR